MARRWLGRVPYRAALEAQRAHRDAMLAGGADEAVWLLEHDRVITTGLRVVDDLPSAELLAALGIDLVRTERGGLATWHGPGQLVGYLLVDWRARGVKVREVVAGVEAGLIAWLVERGVEAHRRRGLHGVWVGTAKVAAVGLHFKRGVSMHGFALNLVNDLDDYAWITPCGVTDGTVTTVRRLVGAAPAPADAAEGVGLSVASALGLPRTSAS